jgi:hypothetical protein
MTLGRAALTSVENNSRPRLMSQRTACTSGSRITLLNWQSWSYALPVSNLLFLLRLRMLSCSQIWSVVRLQANARLKTCPLEAEKKTPLLNTWRVNSNYANYVIIQSVQNNCRRMTAITTSFIYERSQNYPIPSRCVIHIYITNENKQAENGQMMTRWWSHGNSSLCYFFYESSLFVRYVLNVHRSD